MAVSSFQLGSGVQTARNDNNASLLSLILFSEKAIDLHN